MRFRLRTLLLTVAAIALLIVSVQFTLRTTRSVLLRYDHSMHRAFENLEIGDDQETLNRLFGEPWSAEPDFPCIIGYRESDFSSIELKRCVVYLTWSNGINCYYCFGINKDGKIALKAQGNP